MPKIKIHNWQGKLRYELSPNESDAVYINDVCIWNGKENAENPLDTIQDFIKKLEETKQIYIVGHDIPLSISSILFNLLDLARRQRAKQKGIPEEQFEFEDILGFFLGIS
jgi:hypothetical protein